MKTSKRIVIFILLCVVLFLYGGFVTLDWYIFSKQLFDMDHPDIPYSNQSKVMASFLCCIIVWLIGKDGFQKKDTLILKVIALFIFAGDFFFLFDLKIPAIICFGICQILYIIRHSPNLAIYIGSKRPGSHLFLDFFVSGILFLSVLLFFVFVFIPAQGISFFFFEVLAYAIVLCVSLWLACAALRIKYFPKINAVLIWIGITCFFLGDITVGLGFSLTGEPRVIARYLTWIFYLPGLVLPALSGFDLKKMISYKL